MKALEWPLVQRLREGRTNGTLLRWRVTDEHLEAADRIAQLEAEYVAKINDLEEALDIARFKIKELTNVECNDA